MALSLKKYVSVSFFSEQEAREALNATIAQFRRGQSSSDDLSRCEGNMVYVRTENAREAKLIKAFLLSQQGAQPEGCHCKVVTH